MLVSFGEKNQKPEPEDNCKTDCEKLKTHTKNIFKRGIANKDNPGDGIPEKHSIKKKAGREERVNKEQMEQIKKQE